MNQCISIYDLKGTPLNTIKFHEGFMGARIGPVSCLTFHPLRYRSTYGYTNGLNNQWSLEPIYS